MDAIKKIEARQELIAQLRKAAMQISEAGHLGWGNSCIDAAIALEEDAQTLASNAAEVERLRHVLKMISIVDQGCGGNLSYSEMAESAMRQAHAALTNQQPE